MTSLSELENELRPHHNEICLIYGTSLVRLIGVEQTDDGHYYVAQDYHHRPDFDIRGRDTNVIKFSAAGHILPLKAFWPAEDYERMENSFSLNGCPRTDEFLVSDTTIWSDASTHLNKVTHCGRLRVTYDEKLPGGKFLLWRCFPGTDQKDIFVMRGECAGIEDIAQAMIAEMKNCDQIEDEELSYESRTAV